jgi:hypothetical protein
VRDRGRPDGHRDEVAERCRRRQRHGDPRAHDERRAADDQRKHEEERALVAPREDDEERRERDCDRALDEILGVAEEVRREDVVHDEDEEAGEREEDEDRGLVLAPEARDRDDRRRREDERPADDADDAVVRRDLVTLAGRQGRTDARDLGRIGQDVRCHDPGAHATTLTDERRQEHGGHDREVRQHGEHDQCQDRFDRHPAASLAQCRRATPRLATSWYPPPGPRPAVRHYRDPSAGPSRCTGSPGPR